jgi:hypothetical protein
MWWSDRSFKTLAPALAAESYPPFFSFRSILVAHRRGAGQHCTVQHTVGLGESHKKVKKVQSDRVFEAHALTGGAAARQVDKRCFPNQDGLNWKTLLSRRAAPVSFSVSVWCFCRRAHATNTVVSPAKGSGVVTSSPSVDNNPTHPELTFRSFLRRDGRSTRKPLTSLPWGTGARSARTPLATPMRSVS